MSIDTIAIVANEKSSAVERLWAAEVRHDDKRYRCGRFSTIEGAEAAVRALRLKLYTHNELDRVG